MKDRKAYDLDKNIYDIVFTERDEEIRRLEIMRVGIDKDLEEAILAYVKAGGRRGLKKKKKMKISPLALDGTNLKVDNR